MDSRKTTVQTLFLDPRRQSSFERRVVCPVCLSPRLQMVTGICQHRFCTSCVYTESGIRRVGLSRCPTCQMEDSLPSRRPIIPEDAIEMQKTLGITTCPNENCNENMWAWEVVAHLENCHPSPCLDEENISKSNQKRGKLSSKTTPSTDARPPGTNRVRGCEVRELLDAATLRPTHQRRQQHKKRLGSLPIVFNMRYPLRNCNR
ncbi:uncharacterized protein [Apostichopus japonicus]|uniref:uncharacterized protein n=1 Tax=Stichopus japonicus TaxID=307972 RepID=UPI003AB13577